MSQYVQMVGRCWRSGASRSANRAANACLLTLTMRSAIATQAVKVYGMLTMGDWRGTSGGWVTWGMLGRRCLHLARVLVWLY